MLVYEHQNLNFAYSVNHSNESIYLDLEQEALLKNNVFVIHTAILIVPEAFLNINMK